MQTILTDRLGLQHPIIQAPLAGGGDTPELVAAVCEAGALGSIGATYLTPQQIVDASAAVRAKTRRPFGINLFVPERALPDDIPMGTAVARVAPFYEELGLPRPEPPSRARRDFDAQLDAALEGGASVFSFTFGMLPASARDKVKARGVTLAGTATTVDEAVALERAGVDLVVARGSEAGGHRGTFSAPANKAEIGTLALVPQVVDAVAVPVIAAGGIMDGRGIAAALMLGASGVQMGTAFVPCPETGVDPVYVERLLDAEAGDAVLTDAFSGRPMRLLRNRLVDLLDQHRAQRLAFPEQLSMTRNLRKAAATQKNPEFLSMWAGQGVALTRRVSAAELVGSLVSQARSLLSCAGARAESRQWAEKPPL